MADLIKKIKIKKQDGTFTDYIPIGAEAQNITTSDGDSVELKLNKKPYYYNSVADMKADTKLKVGDMAVTLGYYSANDGGAAEYKIVSTTSKYAETLTNSLKAELIIKEKINVKQFGAYGDGTHDETAALINAHNYANSENIEVIYPYGTYYIKTASKTNCPIINTNCDFSNATLLFDPYMDGKYAYIVADPATLDNTKQLQSVSLTSAQIADLTKSNSDAISWLVNYKNCYIHLTTDMSLGQRNYSSTTPTDILYHRQSLKVNDYGQLEPNTLYADIGGNATTVTMRYASCFQPTITLNMGKIVISGNCDNHPCFYITRNNVVVENGTIEKTNYTNAAHVWYNALFAFNNCGHVTFRNFNGNTACAETYAIDQTDYICSFTACYDVHVENNVMLKGHGAFCSHFCSFINFEGNYCNRFDNHYGCYGIMNINNNTITGYPGCVNLGYGDATVNVINNHIESYIDNGKKNCNIIRCRQDFGLMFSGKLNIKDNFYENHTTTIPHFFEFRGSVGVSGTLYPEWGDYRLPELDMVNNKITSTGGNVECYTVDIENKSTKARTYGTCMNFDCNEYSQYQRIYIDFNNITPYDSGALYKWPMKVRNYQLTLIDTSNEKPTWNKPMQIYTYERTMIAPFQTNRFNKENYMIYNFGQIDIRRSVGQVFNYGSVQFVENTEVVSFYNQGGTFKLSNNTAITIYQMLNIQGGFLQGANTTSIIVDSGSTTVININGCLLDFAGTLNFNTCQATITGCRIKNCTITGTGILNLAGNQMNSSMATDLSSGTWSHFYAFGNLANEKTYLVNNQDITQPSI